MSTGHSQCGQFAFSSSWKEHLSSHVKDDTKSWQGSVTVITRVSKRGLTIMTDDGRTAPTRQKWHFTSKGHGSALTCVVFSLVSSLLHWYHLVHIKYIWIDLEKILWLCRNERKHLRVDLTSGLGPVVEQHHVKSSCWNCGYHSINLENGGEGKMLV